MPKYVLIFFFFFSIISKYQLFYVIFNMAETVDHL